MTYTPKYLKRWQKPDHYAGASWPDYYSSGVGRSRDSDDLEESNFHVMLKDLGGEDDPNVIVVRESHWAVGWVEWIAIREDNDKALAIADRNVERMESYPVLDENDWSEREQESAELVWADCYGYRERCKYIREHRSQFEFDNWVDMLNCARGTYFKGYATELLS